MEMGHACDGVGGSVKRHVIRGSFHIKSTQKRDISNQTPAELNNFL
jgi:hypothetical protein